MTLRQAERLLVYLKLQSIYDRETVMGEIKTDERTVYAEEVECARNDFLNEVRREEGLQGHSIGRPKPGRASRP